MKTTERFENAVMKLYNAFHSNKLNANHCQMCAVGNICDNKSEWEYAGDFYTGYYKIASIEDEIYGEELISKTGYSPNELVEVERLFMKACEYKEGSKDQQFKGLCAVVEYLAKLDNIPNPMDYTKLFETENDKPIYELTLKQ